MSVEGASSDSDAFRAGIDAVDFLAGPDGRELHRDTPSPDQEVTVESLLDEIRTSEAATAWQLQQLVYGEDVGYGRRRQGIEDSLDQLRKAIAQIVKRAEASSIGADNMARIKARGDEVIAKAERFSGTGNTSGTPPAAPSAPPAPVAPSTPATPAASSSGASSAPVYRDEIGSVSDAAWQNEEVVGEESAPDDDQSIAEIGYGVFVGESAGMGIGFAVP